MFILVRHAHAGDKHSWGRPDIERPIDGVGERQATQLVETLAGLELRQLVSSPYLRCQQTLAPLAAAVGLLVTDSDRLIPTASAIDVEALVADPGSGGTVFCTHGETLTALLGGWQGAGRLTRPLRPSTTPKGAAWIVTPATAGRWRLHYLPPLRAGKKA